MRIDLTTGGKRPWYVGLILKAMKLRMGIIPGPPLTLSYRPDMFPPKLRNLTLGSANPSRSWDAGQLEVFATFVSKLNSCNF